MITVNTNLASMLVLKNFKSSTNSLNTAIERLTTGFRINSAKDDAVGKAVSIDMDVKLSSNEVVQNNVAMGISMLNTAEGNVNLIKNSVQRCRNLCEQALNDVYDTESQNAVKAELTQIVAQINQTKSTAEFNGISLFEGGSPSVAQTGFKAAVETQNATVVIDETATTVAEAETALRTALEQEGAVIGISNELGLQALANVVNGFGGSANNCSGKTIVLTDNINLNDIQWHAIGDNTHKFKGNFDGNGHSILNMTVTGTNYVGLFGFIEGSTIANTALINATVSGTNYVGGLVGSAGLKSSVTNSYATGSVSGTSSVGGLVGNAYSNSSVTDSTAYTAVSGTGSNIGGFLGFNNNNTTTLSNNKYVDDSPGRAIGNVSGLNPSGVTLDTSETPPSSGGGSSGSSGGGSAITLQIGLDGGVNSQITFNLGLDLSGLDSILSNPASGSNLATLDTILSNITSVETQIGAGLNRLESVQDSLLTQQKTLTAARSIVMDADVSQESARYIRSQILQQASASLLTVANQSPSLLLSLINGMIR